MKKVYFIDLDGTLMTSQKTITDFNRKMLEKATNNGNKIVIVTGRGLNFVKEIGLGKYLTFANNGAAVMQDGKVIESTPIPAETLKTILTLHPRNTLIEYADETPVAAITTFETEEQASFFVNWMGKNTKGRFYTWKDKKTVETTAENVNKANAVEFLDNIIDMSYLTAYISFGDELSDVDLAELVNIAIAPSNVDPMASDAFDHVANMNNNNNYVGLLIEIAESDQNKTPRTILEEFKEIDEHSC